MEISIYIDEKSIDGNIRKLIINSLSMWQNVVKIINQLYLHSIYLSFTNRYITDKNIMSLLTLREY